jgi:hypothetical protein
MDDRFLKDARQEPRPEFARALRERLRTLESAQATHGASRPRLSPVFAAAFALLAVVGLFSIPAVRVSAQAFLDLFRVQNFAAIKVDPARLAQLRNQQMSVEAILGKPEVVQDPGPLRVYTNARDAAAATGYPLREVAAVAGVTADTTFVRGESRGRLRVDTASLRTLLSALAIDDITIPPGIDGAEVNVHLRPVARTVYLKDKARISFLQSPSPELSLPAGIDVAQLGEIGLRIAGLSAPEAKRFAQTIDWHSTMLVPVPANASSFREVDVHGRKGLMITIAERNEAGVQRDAMTQLLWSDGERVYALVGRKASDLTLLQMANAVQ